MKSTEEVQFDWDTAPKAVRQGLMAALRLIQPVRGLSPAQEMELTRRIAAATDPNIAIWLHAHNYLSSRDLGDIALIQIERILVTRVSQSQDRS
jgi:hypothetical protein